MSGVTRRRPSCSTPAVHETQEIQAYDEDATFTALTVGPPIAPPTQLNPIGLQRIRDRLALVTDVRGYTDEMAPAVRNTVRTLLTQDLPALLQAAEEPPAERCQICASTHAIFHELDSDDGEDYPL